MSNLIQYAPILSANGIVTRYNSSDTTLEVVESPKAIKAIVDKAVKEIALFSNTKVGADDMAALCLANFIDDHDNPIKETSRLNILNALGIMKEGKYIRPQLALQLQNRSWHPSNSANKCVHFDELCTHRGISHDPNRKGRTSNRKPNEYHPLNGEIIAREQLVTPNLRAVFNNIPKDKFTATREPVDIPAEFIRKFKKMDLDKQLAVMADLEKELV